MQIWFSTHKLINVINLQVRREWHDIFKTMREENLQLRVLYLVRVSFIFGEIKNFADRQNLKEFKTTKSSLQKC